MRNRCLIIIAISFFLTACGFTNSVSITTTPGDCPNSESTLAPYCMSVTVQNAGGESTGQNYISSTNYPIQINGITVTGATNINTPQNNVGSMDPNGCMTTQLNPGKQCVFYMQLTGEQFGVNNIESVNVTVNYNVNNSFLSGLFNAGSNRTSATSFTVYEITNLYTVMSNSIFNGSQAQNQGFLWEYNAVCGQGSIVCDGRIESADYVNTIGVDNSTFGYVYLGGANGIYQYGVESTSSSISPGGLNGANNLFAVGSTLYATGASTGGAGVWTYSLSNLNWNNTNSVVYSSGSTLFVKNASAMSSSTYYFVGQTGSGNNAINNTTVYACTNNTGGTTGSCNSEGVNAQSAISSIGYIVGAPTPYTGLFIGTQNGIYAESGTTPSSSATWTFESGTNNPITAMTTDGGSNLFAGDNLGNIWLINSNTPTTLTKIVLDSQTNGPILGLKYDINGNTLYFASANSSNNYVSNGYIYSCPLSSSMTCNSVTAVVKGMNGIFAGMGIGSQLINGW